MHSWKPPVTCSYYSSVCTTECSWITIWIPFGLYKVEICDLGALLMHHSYTQDPVPGNQARNPRNTCSDVKLSALLSVYKATPLNSHYMLDIASNGPSIFHFILSFFPRQQCLPNWHKLIQARLNNVSVQPIQFTVFDKNSLRTCLCEKLIRKTLKLLTD